MATLQQAEGYRSTLDDVVTLAQAEALAALVSLDSGRIVRGVPALESALVDIYAGYGLVTATLAADWYQEVRDDAPVGGRFIAHPALTSVPVEQVAKQVGYATAPMYGAEPEVALAGARLAGVTQRMVLDPARGTVLTNVRRDPAAVRWFRGASANACAFCATLASRGAAYRSQETADFTAHNDCRCFPVPLWPGQSAELPDYYDQFQQDYQSARVPGDNHPKAILARMRRATGRK